MPLKLKSVMRVPRSIGYAGIIVLVAALAMVATLPGRTHGLGMITERLLADESLGLSRTNFSDMNLWATLLGGLFCLPCGWLIDRFGLRITLTVTVASLAAVVLAMTQLSGWWPLFGAIVLTRGFGQSALSVISITMVAKWFSRSRLSLAMAVYSLLLSLGFAWAAQIAKPWREDDWRVVWGGMGWILAAFALLAWMVTRDPSPSEVVQEESEEDNAARAQENAPSFTLVEAMRTQAFWVFGITISLIALIGSGLSLFNESVLKEQGFSAEVFYNLITWIGIVGLVVKLPIGWLGQYVALNRLLAAGLLLQAICLIALPRIQTTGAVTAYGAGMGVGGTITTVLFFTIWGQAFGRKHVGQIQGVAQMLTVLASAAGPKVLAECYARYNSYAPAFEWLAMALGVLTFWALMIRMPQAQAVPQIEPISVLVASPGRAET